MADKSYIPTPEEMALLASGGIEPIIPSQVSEPSISEPTVSEPTVTEPTVEPTPETTAQQTADTEPTTGTVRTEPTTETEQTAPPASVSPPETIETEVGEMLPSDIIHTPVGDITWGEMDVLRGQYPEGVPSTAIREVIGERVSPIPSPYIEGYEKLEVGREVYYKKGDKYYKRSAGQMIETSEPSVLRMARLLMKGAGIILATEEDKYGKRTRAKIIDGGALRPSEKGRTGR